MTRRRTGSNEHARCLGMLPVRRPASTDVGRARRAAARRQLPAALQRRTTTTMRLHAAGDRRRRMRGTPVLDTARRTASCRRRRRSHAGDAYPLQGRSLALLQRRARRRHEARARHAVRRRACWPTGGARFRLWAPRRRGSMLELARGGASRRRIADARARATAGTRLTLPGRARRRRATRFRIAGRPRGARSGLALQPRRRARRRARWSTRARFDWRDDGWRGRPVARGGDLRAARRHLHARGHVRRRGRARSTDLAALGVTAIELMPLADFPGRRNWGYDGVLPFAPDAAYGTPEDLKRLVDAAHALRPDGAARRGLQPLRPGGQLPARLRPQFFNPAHQTPWGAAINFDGARSAHGARLLRPQRALLDRGVPLRRPAPGRGARDRATTRAAHIVERARARRCATGPGRERHVHLVLENDAQRGALAGARRRGRRARARAQWNDDFHHALHVLLTGETRRLLRRLRATRPLRAARRARWPRASPTRASRRPSATARARGEPSAPPAARAPSSPSCRTTTRSATAPSASASPRSPTPALLRAARACLLLSPHVPMLFMGEEFAAVHAVPLLLRLRARARRAPCARAGARSSRASPRFARRGGARAHSRSRTPRRPSTPRKLRLGASASAPRARARGWR